MKNKKGEFSFKGYIVGILIVGLFFSIITFFINSLGVTYDDTGKNLSDLAKYENMGLNLTRTINETYAQVDTTNIDPGWFDFISGVWNRVIAPFKFIYRSVVTTTILVTDVVDKLNLLAVVGDFFVAVLLVFVLFRILKHFGIIR